jgi:hypothetical protein
MTRHDIPVRAAGVVAVVVLSLAAALATGGSAATNHQGAMTGSKTFTDPTGDVQGPAPDITSVVIVDEPSGGTIGVEVTAVGYAGVAADSYPMVKVYLDTDQSPTTGSLDQGGAEYAFASARDPEGSYWWIQRWEGSKYVEVAQSGTMRFTRSGDTMTRTVNKTDIGVTKGMSFYIWSSTWGADDQQTGEDVAPDDGSWSFDLSQAAPLTPPVVVKPVIGSPAVTPVKPVAGKRFTIVFPVTRSDTGAALARGTLVCDPSVAGKVLPHAERFKAGKARLSFAVPRTAKGKSLKVKVTIKLGAQSATRVATFRVG